jgi:uncharacterized alpha-E superfamily protein
MLSRVAESLFWMGRYLERTEHMARYINVEYFASLDGSFTALHDRAILSIADMIGLPVPAMEDQINEEEILVGAALDENNPVSILSALFQARENARSVRDSISSELWESINNFYHFVATYPVDIYKTRGLSDFTVQVVQHCSNVRGRITHTLLHDIGWHFIQLGLKLEGAAQLLRIMISKVTDIEEIGKLKLGKSMLGQQWNILLDCLEAKDMCRKYYREVPGTNHIIDFLLFNPHFPRSMTSQLSQVLDSVHKINNKYVNNRINLEFKIGKAITPYHYMETHEIEKKLPDFLKKALSNIYTINDMIASEYFN